MRSSDRKKLILSIIGILLLITVLTNIPSQQNATKNLSPTTVSLQQVQTQKSKTGTIQKQKETIEKPPHDGLEREYSCNALNMKNTFSEKYRSNLLRSIRKSSSFKKVSSLSLKTSRGIQKTELQNMPIPALVALWVILENNVQGLEWDLIVPMDNGTLYRTTAWLEPNGTLLVHEGTIHKFPKRTVDINSLKASFSLGELKSKSATWTSRDYNLLASSLPLLSAVELEVIQGLPIIREKEPKDHDLSKAGLYVYENDYAEIRLYNRMYEGDDKSFVGTPEKAYPSSDFTLLHEIGHAIEKFPLLNWSTVQLSVLEEHNALVTKINQSVRNPSRQKKMLEDLEILKKKLEEAQNQTQSLIQTSPVIVQFQKNRTFTNGPTAYGNTSAGEAFAESFAMFKLDPNALYRIDPLLYQWFEDDGHLRVMQKHLPQERPELLYTKQK